MLNEDELRIAVLSQHLDSVDYYALLEVPRDVERGALRDAFHRFALRFHPDRHVGAPSLQQRANKVFKRGNEAYQVLSNATLRARYDQALERGELRLPAEQALVPGGAVTKGAAAEEISSLEIDPAARPFYEKAVEAVEKGDAGAASMHLMLARSRSKHPLFDKLEARVKALKEKPRRG